MPVTETICKAVEAKAKQDDVTSFKFLNRNKVDIDVDSWLAGVDDTQQQNENSNENEEEFIHEENEYEDQNENEQEHEDNYKESDEEEIDKEEAAEMAGVSNEQSENIK